MKPTNQLKRFFSALLVILAVLSAVPTTASAVAPAVVTVVSDKTSNPLFDSGVIGEVWGDAAASQLLSDISGGAVGPTQENYLVEVEDVLEAIADGMENRQGTISIGWQIARTKIANNAELKALLKTAFYAAMEHTGVPTRGDYLAWTWNNMQYTCSPQYCNGDYLLDITYRVTYYTSASQEKKLSEEIDDIIDDFDLPASADPYTVVEEVYDYICDEVEYDHSNDGSMLKYTAYAAVMKGEAVCQGYATLLYRMLLELGIDCRVITGDTNGDGYSDHAWNIVKLGQSYYNADSTWDAGRSRYNYFLRCPSNFSGHTRDDSYTTSKFHADYPMAKKDYSKTATPLSIVTQPKSVTVKGGETATVSVVAKGDGLKYQWYYTSNASDTMFRKSSTTTATYSTEMDSSRAGRQVYCVITDSNGSKVQTNTVTLSMVPGIEITTQPASASAGLNQTVSTKVVAKGDGLKYQWYYTSNASDTVFRKSSTTTATYSTPMDATRDGRQVYCVITDKYGAQVTTATATLTLTGSADVELKITQQPQNVTVKNGATAEVTVEAEGEGLSYQWYYTSNGTTTQFFASSNTTATYTTPMDASRAGRQVYCIVTDRYGNTVKSDTVTLNMEQEGGPKITEQPQSITVADGETAEVTVVAEGEGLSYQWYYTSNGTTTQFYASSNTTATYTTPMDASRAGRQVYCIITDTNGNTVKSDTVTLNMEQEGGPKITRQPQSITVANGETAEVTVEAEGEGLSYQWYYTSNGTTTQFYASSNTTATYTTPMDASRAGRQVYCIITDANGNMVRSNTVTLNMA